MWGEVVLLLLCDFSAAGRQAAMFPQFTNTAASLTRATALIHRVGTDAYLYDDPEDANIASLLDSKFEAEKVQGLKRLIALLSQGVDVSNFFPQVCLSVRLSWVSFSAFVQAFLRLRIFSFLGLLYTRSVTLSNALMFLPSRIHNHMHFLPVASAPSLPWNAISQVSLHPCCFKIFCLLWPAVYDLL